MSDFSIRQDDNDEIIAGLEDHYYDMMQEGIDLRPVRPSGDMVGNPFAMHTHILELIAYSKAIGRQSRSKEF